MPQISPHLIAIKSFKKWKENSGAWKLASFGGEKLRSNYGRQEDPRN
jgi:hypothetical protein